MSVQYPDSSNIRFLLANIAETATLTSTPVAVADQSVSNLLFSGAYKQTVITATAVVIEATWGSNQTINTVVLDKHNLTTTATVVYELFDGTNTLLNTKTFTSIVKCLSWCLDVNNPATTVRKVKITISDDNNPDLFIKLNRLGIGNAFVPVINMQAGISLQYQDTGKTERAKSGAMTVFPGNIYRDIKISLDFMSNVERNYLANYFRTMGIRGSVYINPYPNYYVPVIEQDHEGFFHLSGNIPVFTHQFVDMFSVSLELSDSELLV